MIASENPTGWEIGMHPSGTGGVLRRGDDRVWKGLDGRWWAWVERRGCAVAWASLETAMDWVSNPKPVDEHPGWEVRAAGVNGEPAIWWRIAPGAVDRAGRTMHDEVRFDGGLWWCRPAGRGAWGLYKTAGGAIAALDRWNSERSAETVAEFARWVNEAVDDREKDIAMAVRVAKWWAMREALR